MAGNKSKRSTRRSGEDVTGSSSSRNRIQKENQEHPDEYLHVHTALAQALILEIILEYGIRTDEGDLSSENIQNLRLVQKAWKSGVNKILYKNGEPLYKLNLVAENSLNEYVSVQANGKDLERFVNFYTTSNPKPAQVATFSLKIADTFFQLENYDSFYSCLRDCGQGLVKLELNIPENGGSLPGALPNLTLPLLNSLSVTLTGNVLNVCETPGFDNPTNILLLMQSILNKVEVLKELTFYCEPEVGLPSGLQYIGLPTSIKSLDVTCDDTTIVLELLLKSQLPNLDTLNFTPEYGLPTQTLYQVLEKFKKQLKCLCLYARYVYEPPRNVNFVRFPVMKNLEELTLWSPHIELGETQFGNRTFPSLKDLMLYQQTPQMFAKFVSGGAPLTSVENLKVQIIDETVSQDDGNTALISLDVMKSIATTFNNISKLNLKVCGEERDAVAFVFKEMTQLKCLSLTVLKHDDIVSSDHWDSVLTGLPVEFITGLRACPDLWGKVNVDQYEERISVKNLTELSKLELVSLDENDDDSEPRTPYLNSDLVFHFALLYMPNLQTLLFRGRFFITETMLKEW